MAGLVVVREIVTAHVDELTVDFVAGFAVDQEVPENGESDGQEEAEGPTDDATEGGDDEQANYGQAGDKDDPSEVADVSEDGADGRLTFGVRDRGVLRSAGKFHR